MVTAIVAGQKDESLKREAIVLQKRLLETKFSYHCGGNHLLITISTQKKCNGEQR